MKDSLSAVVDKSKCFDAFVAVSGSTLKDKFLPECLQDAIQMVKGMTAMGRVVRGVKAPRYNTMTGRPSFCLRELSLQFYRTERDGRGIV